MTHELWDLVGHNLIESASSPAPILETVRASIAEDGPAAADELSYRVLDDDDRTIEKLTGAALIARASDRIPA